MSRLEECCKCGGWTLDVVDIGRLYCPRCALPECWERLPTATARQKPLYRQLIAILVKASERQDQEMKDRKGNTRTVETVEEFQKKGE